MDAYARRLAASLFPEGPAAQPALGRVERGIRAPAGGRLYPVPCPRLSGHVPEPQLHPGLTRGQGGCPGARARHAHRHAYVLAASHQGQGLQGRQGRALAEPASARLVLHQDVLLSPEEAQRGRERARRGYGGALRDRPQEYRRSGTQDPGRAHRPEQGGPIDRERLFHRGHRGIPRRYDQRTGQGRERGGRAANPVPRQRLRAHPGAA